METINNPTWEDLKKVLDNFTPQQLSRPILIWEPDEDKLGAPDSLKLAPPELISLVEDGLMSAYADLVTDDTPILILD